MSKRAKILLILTSLALLLVVYLIFTLKPVNIASQQQRETGQASLNSEPLKREVDAEVLSQDYQEAAQAIVNEIIIEQNGLKAYAGTSTIGQDAETASTTDEFTAKALERVGALKIKLMEIKVPLAYKDLHLELLLVLNQMENFITAREKADIEGSIKSLNSLAIDYDWLRLPRLE